MKRTPPHDRFSRRFDSDRLLELEPPPSAPLRLTPEGRAALERLRASSAHLFDEDEDESEGET